MERRGGGGQRLVALDLFLDGKMLFDCSIAKFCVQREFYAASMPHGVTSTRKARHGNSPWTKDTDEPKKIQLSDDQKSSRTGAAIFGIILMSCGCGKVLVFVGCRSLTAAQAATGFTRNCVLGFGRKTSNFQKRRDTRLRKVLIRHFAYLNPCFIKGAWSYLYRDMERGTLFSYPRARTQTRRFGGVK